MRLYTKRMTKRNRESAGYVGMWIVFLCARGPAPKRCKKRMCFLVNSPPAAGEKFSGSISPSRLAPIRIGRGRRPDECGLRRLLSAGGSGGAGGIAYLQQFSSSVEPAAGGRGRVKAGPSSPGGASLDRAALLSVLSEDAPIGASPGGNAKEVTRRRRRVTTTV